MKIGIIGLGLMGGSFAKAIKKYTSHEVFAYDIREDSLGQAIRQKAIDGILDLDDLAKIDLTILAMTPTKVLNFVEDHRQLSSYVMDLCGIKRAISPRLCDLAEENNFTYIGAHPMAGREVGGFENSCEDLYRGRYIIIIKHGDLPKWIIEMLNDIGLSIQYSTDDRQDRIIAYTSQLCHIASNALVKSPTSLDHEGYSADSLVDLTRVATIDEKMWTELFFANKDYLLGELSNYIIQLNKYQDALVRDDEEGIRDLLKEGKDIKAKMYPRKSK